MYPWRRRHTQWARLRKITFIYLIWKRVYCLDPLCTYTWRLASTHTEWSCHYIVPRRTMPGFLLLWCWLLSNNWNCLEQSIEHQSNHIIIHIINTAWKATCQDGCVPSVLSVKDVQNIALFVWVFLGTFYVCVLMIRVFCSFIITWCFTS